MQNQDIEYEFEAKGLLTREAYNQLVYFFKKEEVTPEELTNSFFDNHRWELNKKGITLRTRSKSNHPCELTLKEDGDHGGRLETHHRPLSLSQKIRLRHNGEIPAGNVKNALLRLKLNDVFIYQGDLVIHRIEFNYRGCKIALDHNLYLQLEDWEIEVEREASGVNEQVVLRDILNSLGIEYIKAMSKRKRFFNQIKNQKELK